MSAVLIASITELCALDHAGDPTRLDAWLANKTPQMVRRMFDNPRLTLLVAERDGEVVAVGAVDGDDVVALNYVSPRHRFHGVSSALLAALEALIWTSGARIGRLGSTRTAESFYRARGWVDDEGMPTERTARGIPLRKALTGPEA